MTEDYSSGKGRLASMAGRPLLHVFIIVFLGLALYSNTLYAPFQWDEEEYMQNNPVIEDIGNFRDPSKAKGLEYYGALRSRYIGYLTFAINYRLHGWAVEGYHAFNISVHVTNALLVYLLVLLTLRTPFFTDARRRSPAPGTAPQIALFAALAFVAHPVQIEAVTYVFQRFAALVTLFYLLSVAAYAGARLSEGRARSYALYGLSLVSAVLAMKTKENAFTLPFAVVLYEFLFFSGPAGRRLLRLAPLLMTLPIIPMSLGLFVHSGDIIGKAESITRGYREWNRVEYFSTEMRVVLTYVRLLFFPVNQNIDYGYPLASSFFEARVIGSSFFHLAVLGSGLWMLRRSGSSSPLLRLSAFGVFWFYLTLSVESSVVPIAMAINEYRLYLPSAGALAALAAGGFHFFGKLGSGRPRIAAVAFAVIMLAALSVATYARNGLWNNKILLWGDTVAKSPNKARPHFNLGNQYLQDGQTDKAIEHFLTAVRITPGDARVHTNLGLAYERKGLFGVAVEQYLRAIDLDPKFAKAYNNLGSSYGSLGQWDEARKYLLIAIGIDPEFAEAYNNLGSVYGSEGRMEEAAENFRIAIRLNPDFAQAYNNLGIVYSTKGQYDQAIESFEAALKLSPDNADVHRNIGIAYSSMGLGNMAEKHFRMAKELSTRK